jgi:protein-tyrosine phosphatase
MKNNIYRKPLRTATKIRKNLYIGGERNIEELFNLECDAILDLRNEGKNNIIIKKEMLSDYVQINIHDGNAQSQAQFEQAFSVLETFIKKYKKVAVICHEGVSRSASLIIIYLMSKGNSYDEARNKLIKLRPIIAPHPNFIPILEYFEVKFHNTKRENKM